MSEITPEKVAAAVCDTITGWRHSLQAALSLTAEGNTLSLSVTRWEDDEEGTEIVRHYRAPVVEGEQTPIVLPAGAAGDYVNGDDGYWLTCGTCETPLMEVKAGTSVGEMAEKIAAHKCAEAAAIKAEQKAGRTPIRYTATGFGTTTTQATGQVVLNIHTADGPVHIDLGTEYAEPMGLLLLDNPECSDGAEFDDEKIPAALADPQGGKAADNA
ncbi:hypothetical protein ACQP2T_63800 (plasmid) [Nonomuraea sp. CA-143628]|uniref:hypothetical protein n=1 Tax=Nonomuraea sp. CA-143628 TaxID=3239997 RepID=UPI003D8D4ADD